MDNLGVAMNATTIEAYALSKGIKESYANMDNATKIGLAMEMFLEKTTYAAGNYAKENKTFAGSFNTLKAATSNFLSGAGGIEDVANALVDFGGILTQSIGEMAPTIVEGLVSLTETLMPQIPVLIANLLPVVLEGAIGIINGLVAIFPELIRIVSENLPTILQAGITILLALVTGISQSLPELIPTIVEAVILIVDTLINNLDLLIDASLQLILALAEGLIEALPLLLDKVPILVEKLLMAIADNLPKLLETGIKLTLMLAQGLIKSIPSILAFVPQMFLGLINAITSYYANMLQLGKNIVNKFKDGFANIKDIGKQLINGLWQGIQEKWNDLKNKVEDLGEGIVKKFKSVFEIASPSKVFKKEIGYWLAEGVGAGFTEDLDSVYKDMQRAIDIETDKMTSNIQTTGTYQMAMAGMPTFNLVDNASNTTQLVVNGKVLAEVVNTENRNREVATS